MRYAPVRLVTLRHRLLFPHAITRAPVGPSRRYPASLEKILADWSGSVHHGWHSFSLPASRYRWLQSVVPINDSYRWQVSRKCC